MARTMARWRWRWGLHCLSAFTASTTDASQEMAHHEVCLHCLSAFTASTTMNEPITKQHISASPLPFGIHRVHHNEPLPEALKVAARLHCLSAFTASTTGRASRHKALPKCLHCLSAFTASTTSVMLTVVAVKSEVSIAFRHSPRPPLLTSNRFGARSASLRQVASRFRCRYGNCVSCAPSIRFSISGIEIQDLSNQVVSLAFFRS